MYSLQTLIGGLYSKVLIYMRFAVYFANCSCTYWTLYTGQNVYLGLHDPSFVTSLIKSLLKKRSYLRKHGRTREAGNLAVRINELIRDIRSRRLVGMTDASNRELWNAVKANSKKRNQVLRHSAYFLLLMLYMAILLKSLLTLFTISEMLWIMLFR